MPRVLEAPPIWPGKRTSTQAFTPRPMSTPRGGLGPSLPKAAAKLDASAGARPVPLLVDADLVEAGQLLKSAFLAQLHPLVVAAANQELAPMTATGCPFIEQYFARYQAASAAETEALIARFAPASREARAAADLLAPLVARIREGIRDWKSTGKLPADLEAAAPGAAAAANEATNGEQTLDSLEAELGPGQPLDPGTASSMAGAVGSGLGEVRVHTDANAARKAAEVDARAFAVGQNVVFAAGAYQPGTPAGDVLLAHELAHVAQQAEASRDPVARKKAIGDEASGSEAAADGVAGQVMTQLGGGREKTSTFGDLLQTGLQLQRCPGNSMPAGPPMSGKQADQHIATVPVISDAIQSDIRAGIDGEHRVHLYDDFDAYVQDLASKVPRLLLVPADKRVAAAREFAKKAPGFTDPDTRHIDIYTQGTPAFVTIHEVIHLHTDTRHLSGNVGLGEHFVEGAADYFTEMVCRKNGVPFEAAYPREREAVGKLAAEIGDERLAALTFHGAVEPAKLVLDSKAKGTWKAYVTVLKSEEFPAAAALLVGAHQANEARIEKEQDAQQQAEVADKAQRDAAETKERATWPPEATSPIVASRIIGRSIVAGKTRFMVGIGGRNGVREGWTAQIKLKGGGTFHATVVKVVERASHFEVPDPRIAETVVEPVELRPRSP